MKASATNAIRILIADDHPVVREGLVAILQSEKDLEVVGETADGAQACELYARYVPDVLILDQRMPKKDVFQAVTELMSSWRPKPRIIVMTAYETEEDIRRALQAGAKGYLVKRGQRPNRFVKLSAELPEAKLWFRQRSRRS